MPFKPQHPTIETIAPGVLRITVPNNRYEDRVYEGQLANSELHITRDNPGSFFIDGPGRTRTVFEIELEGADLKIVAKHDDPHIVRDKHG